MKTDSTLRVPTISALKDVLKEDEPIRPFEETPKIQSMESEEDALHKYTSHARARSSKFTARGGNSCLVPTQDCQGQNIANSKRNQATSEQSSLQDVPRGNIQHKPKRRKLLSARVMEKRLKHRETERRTQVNEIKANNENFKASESTSPYYNQARLKRKRDIDDEYLPARDSPELSPARGEAIRKRRKGSKPNEFLPITEPFLASNIIGTPVAPTSMEDCKSIPGKSSLSAQNPEGLKGSRSQHHHFQRPMDISPVTALSEDIFSDEDASIMLGYTPWRILQGKPLRSRFKAPRHASITNNQPATIARMKNHLGLPESHHDLDFENHSSSQLSNEINELNRWLPFDYVDDLTLPNIQNPAYGHAHGMASAGNSMAFPEFAEYMIKSTSSTMKKDLKRKARSDSPDKPFAADQMSEDGRSAKRKRIVQEPRLPSINRWGVLSEEPLADVMDSDDQSEKTLQL